MDHGLSPRALMCFIVAGLSAITADLWWVMQASDGGHNATWRALVIIPVLLMLNVPLLLRAGRREPEPWFMKLLVWAFVLKCLASAARYVMAFVVYDGNDGQSYSVEGARLAQHYLDGNFDAKIGRQFIGTGFMRVATAVVYMGTGPSIAVAWALFSIFGFWGTYFLYRAFRVALPEGDARRYALLVLMLPSMLFWPSGLGKEAFVVLGIGLIAYASALVLSGYHTWLLPMLFGVLITGVVRPHITAALFTALVAAWFLRRRPNTANELTPVAYVGGAAAILVAGAGVASFAASFLDVDLSLEGFDSAISDTTELTDEGGSTFTPVHVDSPVQMPFALFTILFRPLVFEATNPQMMLAAVEGSLLMLLVGLSWRVFPGIVKRLRRQPYLIFSVVYVVVFCYAFSNFGNFGILTRQRVQVLPFFLVFLALRPPRLHLRTRSAPAHEESALT